MNAPTPKSLNRPQRLALLAGLFLLSGCATQRGVVLPGMDDWQRRAEVLGEVSEWAFSGRIAVKTADDGFNGRLRWHQTDDNFKASISGPLGAGSVQIAGSQYGISVVESGGEITRLDEPERDLRVRYGWTIPVTSLRYWALGIPDPVSPADTEFGPDGELTRIEQRDWVVEIGQYREGGGQQMPRRMTATRGDSRVRLVIDSWTFF